jgi:dTDP-glucose 4,6-dehydratase
VFGTAYGEISFGVDDRLNPQNPYSAGKASAEMACVAWSEVTGLPITITRTANMFGEMQDSEKMIPRTIGLLLKNKPATLHAFEGKYGVRQWLHAKNSADSVLFILQNVLKDLRFNINGQIELDNLQIAQAVAFAMEKELKFEVIDALQVRPGYDRKYRIDDSLIKSYGWKPPIDFLESLVDTVKWSVENPQWVKIRNSQQ